MVRQANGDTIKNSSSCTSAHLVNNLYFDTCMMKEMYHKKAISRDKNLKNNYHLKVPTTRHPKSKGPFKPSIGVNAATTLQ